MFTLCPSDPTFLETVDFLLKLLGAIGAAVLFFIGLKRYNKSQTWKKKEFLANEIRVFTSDEVVQNAMLMLDWEGREIKLFPDEEIPNDRYVHVDRAILTAALRYGFSATGKPITFNDVEIEIRDTFSVFFDYFERFQDLIDSKLIEAEDLIPYLIYWIESISNRKDEPYVRAIYQFIISYKFEGTQALFKEFGHPIPGSKYQ